MNQPSIRDSWVRGRNRSLTFAASASVPVHRILKATLTLIRIHHPYVPNKPKRLPRRLAYFPCCSSCRRSRCSALIYETVCISFCNWAIGSTAVSLGCLAGHFNGRTLHRSVCSPPALGREHPLRIYAYLELGIAASAILVQSAAAAGEHGLYRRRRARHAGSVRGFLSAHLPLPPTILMARRCPPSSVG